MTWCSGWVSTFPFIASRLFLRTFSSHASATGSCHLNWCTQSLCLFRIATPVIEIMYGWTPKQATLVASIFLAFTSIISLASMFSVKLITVRGWVPNHARFFTSLSKSHQYKSTMFIDFPGIKSVTFLWVRSFYLACHSSWFCPTVRSTLKSTLRLTTAALLIRRKFSAVIPLATTGAITHISYFLHSSFALESWTVSVTHLALFWSPPFFPKSLDRFHRLDFCQSSQLSYKLYCIIGFRAFCKEFWQQPALWLALWGPCWWHSSSTNMVPFLRFFRKESVSWLLCVSFWCSTDDSFNTFSAESLALIIKQWRHHRLTALLCALLPSYPVCPHMLPYPSYPSAHGRISIGTIRAAPANPKVYR